MSGYVPVIELCARFGVPLSQFLRRVPPELIMSNPDPERIRNKTGRPIKHVVKAENVEAIEKIFEPESHPDMYEMVKTLYDDRLAKLAAEKILPGHPLWEDAKYQIFQNVKKAYAPGGPFYEELKMVMARTIGMEIQEDLQKPRDRPIKKAKK
jgi:hypothetical protein